MENNRLFLDKRVPSPLIDKYGDDPNAVDFLESEYVEIFNGMMSQYYPYPY